VVLSDVAPAMTAIAADRAAVLGLDAVRTMVLDLERIDQPDGRYDVVLCRDGLQLASEPGSATREIHRVLRPGGRTALVTWGPQERNPWLGVLFDAISAEIGVPVPPPGIPGPFSLPSADRLRELLSGFADVSVTELSVPLQTPSFDDWWSRTTALTGPLAKRLAAMSDDAVAAIRARAAAAAAPYKSEAGLEFPGLALLAAGHR
jgi:SAM-dependent methyltransferase